MEFYIKYKTYKTRYYSHKIYSKETPNENISEVVYYDMQKLFLHLENTLLRYSNLSQLPAYYISHL